MIYKMKGFLPGDDNLRWVQRALWASIGAGIFFWIGYEDRTSVGPVVLGGALALGLALHVGRRVIRDGFPHPGWRFALLGFLAGLAAMPLAVLSMLIKVSLHGHVPPDFTASQILAVLERMTVWAGAGALIGLALLLLKGCEFGD